jgi:hypothetical protein
MVESGKREKEREKGPGPIVPICSGILRFMPRRPRIHLAGMPLHSVQRGRNREAYLFGEDDYLTYCHGLGEALKESGCALYAYVLIEQPCAFADCGNDSGRLSAAYQ